MDLEKFVSPSETFASDIEKLVNENQLNYLDAIIHWCEKKQIEPENAAQLVSSNVTLRRKLQNEAENLNFIPRSTRIAI